MQRTGSGTRSCGTRSAATRCHFSLASLWIDLPTSRVAFPDIPPPRLDMLIRLLTAFVIAGVAIAVTDTATAQHSSPATLNSEFVVHENPDGTIIAYSPAGTWVFDSWRAYVASEFFRRYDARCGTESIPEYSDEPQTEASTSDWTAPCR